MTGSNSSEAERLEEGVKRIVTSRERMPRAPKWHRAWWRTLQRYNRRLSALRRQQAGDPDEPAEE